MSEWVGEWDSGAVKVDVISGHLMSLPVVKESKHLLMESRQTLQFHWKPNRAWEEQREVVSEMTDKQINILVNTTPQVFRVLRCGAFQGGIT